MNTIIDPTMPCPFPPRSIGKLRWLQGRARLRLPLFQQVDAGDVDTLDMQDEPFARLVPTPTWDGLLSEPAARQLVAEVLAGERDAAEVAARVGVSRRAVKCAVLSLRRWEAWRQTA